MVDMLDAFFLHEPEYFYNGMDVSLAVMQRQESRGYRKRLNRFSTL